LQTELVAKKIEKTLLTRTTESRVKELSRGLSRMRELREGDAAVPRRRKAI
jgi:circadian clock protein KaiC